MDWLVYAKEWSWFHNFFCPSLKLARKERIKSRWVKTYEKPVTPYQRLLQWSGLREEKRKHLEELYQQLDPIALKTTIERKLKCFFTAMQQAKKSKAV